MLGERRRGRIAAPRLRNRGLDLRGELRTIGETVERCPLKDGDELRHRRFIDPGASPDRLRPERRVEGRDIVRWCRHKYRRDIRRDRLG